MKKDVALVLSSGGSRGLSQIGVISELEKQGYNITSVSGSSIGSLIGGLYAMGKLKDFTDWIMKFSRKDVWWLMDFTITTHGLLKGERVFDKMKTFIPDMNIEDMSIPLSLVATDILNEKQVVFTCGSFYEAVRASVAIPAVFLPVKYKGSILVDGGVLNPIPIDHVKRKSGDMLVVVNLYGEKISSVPKDKEVKKSYLSGLKKAFTSLISTGDKRSLDYLSLLDSTTSAMVHRIAEMSIEKYKPDLVINIPNNSASTFDFYRAKELIELGEKSTKESILKNLKISGDK